MRTSALQYITYFTARYVMVLPNPLYTTNYGAAYVGDSLLLLEQLEADSVDLVLTSPPFAL